MSLEYDFYDHGGEATLVLLHSLALDRSMWRWFEPYLAGRFDVVVPDLPGHGGSPPLATTSIVSMGDEVASLIRQRQSDPVILVGLSLGGCVAQQIAVAHPELVSALGLIDTTCWYGPTAAADWEGRAQKALTEGLDSLAEFQLARWFTPAFLEGSPDLGQELLETFRSTHLDSYAATCRAMGVMDLRPVIEGIGVPTAILVGEEDYATPIAAALQLRDLIPSSVMHVIPGCSHLSAIEKPDEVARLLNESVFSRAYNRASRDR